jgi:hypothetical protein
MANSRQRLDLSQEKNPLYLLTGGCVNPTTDVKNVEK